MATVAPQRLIKGQQVDTPIGKATIARDSIGIGNSKVLVQYERGVMGQKPWIDAFGSDGLVKSPVQRWIDRDNISAEPTEFTSILKPFLFRPGQIVTTPGAAEALMESGDEPNKFLKRHLRGDWGDLCAADKKENELSVKEGFRILSSYQTSKGVKFWIITEADRSYTTFLLPSEY